MIAKTLKQIVTGLNDHLMLKYTSTTEQVILKSGNDTSLSTSSIDVTLINVEEDKVYKNHLIRVSNPPMNKEDDKNPMGGISAMRVNLYVLFAFQGDGGTAAYENTLTRLSDVLEYFQGKQYQEIIIPPATVGGDPTRFNVEINYHNISLEDSNNMWSNLGGKQKPYAMYQIKMLELRPAFVPDPVAVIQDARISNPEYDLAGDIIIDPITNDPANDDNQIQHK